MQRDPAAQRVEHFGRRHGASAGRVRNPARVDSGQGTGTRPLAETEVEEGRLTRREADRLPGNDVSCHVVQHELTVAWPRRYSRNVVFPANDVQPKGLVRIDA